MLDEIALERFAAHDEVQVDLREHLRVGLGALGLELHVAAAHRLAALLQDHHHVVGGAAAAAREHHFHRPRREVAAAALGRAVHRHQVAASGLGDEGHSLAPAHRAFHGRDYRFPLGTFLCKIRAFRDFGRLHRMTTYTAKPETIDQAWVVVDARDKVLGRLASQIAMRLRGKHRPEYTPHVDTGDYVVVVNAAKLRVTGRKADDKLYIRHSGRPGGLKSTTFAKLNAKKPGRALELAVKGMLPKGPLGYAMLRKLKIYAGGSHPHSAQQPKALEIG